MRSRRLRKGSRLKRTHPLWPVELGPKAKSPSSRLVMAPFQLPGCRASQTNGKVFKWSGEVAGVYEAAFLCLEMKSENSNGVFNMLMSWRKVTHVSLEWGHWDRGKKEDTQRSYYPVSHYEIEWAHIRPSVIQVTNDFVEPMWGAREWELVRIFFHPLRRLGDRDLKPMSGSPGNPSSWNCKFVDMCILWLQPTLPFISCSSSSISLWEEVYADRSQLQ